MMWLLIDMPFAIQIVSAHAQKEVICPGACCRRRLQYCMALESEHHHGADTVIIALR